jgi:hypothetical protein
MNTNPMISMVSRANSTVCTDIALLEVIAKIQDGTWAVPVGEYRAILKARGKKAARAKKEALPACKYSGTFRQAGNEYLLQHSGYICVDIDKLGDEAAAVRNRLAADPHCLFAFVSAGGQGVKALFRCDPARPHLESWQAVTDYIHNKYDLKNDASTKNVGRINFVSYDPDATINLGEVSVIPYPVAQAAGTPACSASVASPAISSEPLSAADVTELLRWIPTRPIYDEWLKVASAVSAALPDTSEAIEVLRQWSPEEEDNQYAEKLANCLHEIGVGTLFYMALNNGWKRSPAFKAVVPTAAVAEAEKAAFEQKLASCEFGVAPAPIKPVPRFSLAGIPICTPGNLTRIASQAKTGKTAVVGAILAATLVEVTGLISAAGVTAPDCLGITSSDMDGRAVLHFDTEQSLYDHHAQIHRAFRRAQADSQSIPAWFHSYCLTGLGVKEALDLIRFAARSEAEKQGVHAIIIDGVGDLVADVNEPTECNALVAELHALAMDCDCSIILIVHENPGQTTGKARGHLGSQLERKSETNLRLKKKGEATVVYGEQCRGPAIPEKKGPCFSWNGALEMHTSVPSMGESAEEQKTSDLRSLADECLADGPLKYAKFIKAIANARGWTSKTAEKHFTDMKKAGVISQDPSKFWVLSSA